MLRGAKLLNTEWIIGCVAYTGWDTKVMRNSESSSMKHTKVERMMNYMIILIFIFQFLCCFIIAIGCGVWTSNNAVNYSYFIENRYTPSVEGILAFFTTFALTTSMIPISLIISLEFVKVSQSAWINADKDMYCAKNDRKVKCFSSSLNEELGQIEFIFTDKTGTLTSNTMVFKFALIGHQLYGDKSILENTPNVGLKTQGTAMGKDSEVEFDFNDKTLTKIITGTADHDENPKINMTIQGMSGGGATYNFQYDIVKEFF